MIAIIAVGYNRPEAMKRLLESLNDADYEDDKVKLVISIDKGTRQDEVYEVANQFKWKYGNKEVIKFDVKLGLKKHILKCGDLTHEYESVILLEDDLTVAESFYLYARESLLFYESCELIAGISLYKHEINVNVNRPFNSSNNGYDTFLFQFAQSWGQCWNKAMWKNFKNWYDMKPIISNICGIPANVRNWDERSWLKYFMAYIVENNLYYVYPQISLTTNHSEVGTHNNSSSHDYQVHLLEGKKKHYNFAPVDDAVIYDAYFERVDILKSIYPNVEKNISLDLYGSKELLQPGILITTKKLKKHIIIDSWSLAYRPHELNCIHKTPGKDIFVYEINKTMKIEDDCVIEATGKLWRYDYKRINWKKAIILLRYESITKLISILKRK